MTMPQAMAEFGVDDQADLEQALEERRQRGIAKRNETFDAIRKRTGWTVRELASQPVQELIDELKRCGVADAQPGRVMEQVKAYVAEHVGK